MGAAASAQLTFQEFTLQTKYPLSKTFVRQLGRLYKGMPK